MKPGAPKSEASATTLVERQLSRPTADKPALECHGRPEVGRGGQGSAKGRPFPAGLALGPEGRGAEAPRPASAPSGVVRIPLLPTSTRPRPWHQRTSSTHV